MGKIAVYYYPGAIITLTLISGKLVMTDETGATPFCGPLHARHHMDTTAGVGVSIPSYDEVGLFYGYSMPGIGWDGDVF